MVESLVKGIRKTSLKTLSRNGTAFLRYVCKQLQIEDDEFKSDLELAELIKAKVRKERKLNVPN